MTSIFVTALVPYAGCGKKSRPVIVVSEGLGGNWPVRDPIRRRPSSCSLWKR